MSAEEQQKPMQHEITLEPIIVVADEDRPWIWLQRMRRAQGWTQKELGLRLRPAASQQRVSTWEITGPPLYRARQIASVCGCSTEVIELFHEAVVKLTSERQRADARRKRHG